LDRPIENIFFVIIELFFIFIFQVQKKERQDNKPPGHLVSSSE